MQNLQSMEYKYSFTDGTTWVLDPPRSYSALGNTTNSQKHHGTFQVFIDATNVWSQQHSLFLEWANLEFIVTHVESVPACSKKVGRPGVTANH